jgi:thiol-disulfide isomerase/thioredoxin
MERILQKRSRVFLGFFFFLTALSTAQTVRPLTAASLDSLISNRNGKLLLLNVWATWCGPCKEEFPDLITLSRSLPPSKAEVVALSIDYPDETESLIAPFIATMAPPFPVFVADIEPQDSLINALNPQWSGAVPATIIYDSSGRRRTFLTGLQTLKTFKKAVDDVLRKQ